MDTNPRPPSSGTPPTGPAASGPAAATLGGWRAVVAGRESWLVAGFGGAALLALSRDSGTVLCPFRRGTGGYCPFCGATRSLGAATRLEPAEALRLYPLLPLLGILAVVTLWPGLVGPATRRRLMIVGVVAIGAQWVVRLAFGDIPRPSGLSWPL